MTGLALKEDPTIMAIELGNEYRCGGSNIGQKFPSDPACTTTTITKFIEEISGYIKMVDTNHLVAVGDEGFFSRGPVYNGVYQNVYDGSSGNSFEDVAQISSVDILGFHLVRLLLFMLIFQALYSIWLDLTIFSKFYIAYIVVSTMELDCIY